MKCLVVLACLAASLPAAADEQPVELKPGPGMDVVNDNCGGCHTMDYIRMNSPFLTAAGWQAEVAKMRAAYGAPISDSDAAAIQRYLAANYGAPAP
jgi:mono/diheme cytochrome c family protein